MAGINKRGVSAKQYGIKYNGENGSEESCRKALCRRRAKVARRKSKKAWRGENVWPAAAAMAKENGGVAVIGEKRRATRAVCGVAPHRRGASAQACHQRQKLFARTRVCYARVAALAAQTRGAECAAAWRGRQRLAAALAWRSAAAPGIKRLPAARHARAAQSIMKKNSSIEAASSSIIENNQRSWQSVWQHQWRNNGVAAWPSAGVWRRRKAGWRLAKLASNNNQKMAKISISKMAWRKA
jgi:hypothetical protein